MNKFKELSEKVKAGTATPDEIKEFDQLKKKSMDRHRGGGRKKNPGTNDLAWWNQYPELTKDVTNLAFNYIAGTDVKVTDLSLGKDPLRLGNLAVAGYVPTIGKSTSDSDGFNTQMRQLWLDMHRKYRGMGGYQKSDLGIAIFCIMQAFALVAYFERIYGIINTYSLYNRTVPKLLKEAFGISNDLETNVADFRYTLNRIISKAQSLCLPKGYAIFESNIILNSFIFKDAESKRASLFAFNPAVYYIWDPTISPTGSAAAGYNIESVMNGSTPDQGYPAWELNDIQTLLDRVFDALLNDDDISKMCSDLLAAYGENAVQTVGYLPEDYKCPIVYDYERQLQFHNMTLCGGGVSSKIFDGILNPTNANLFLGAEGRILIGQFNNVIINRLMNGDDSGQGYPTDAGQHWTSQPRGNLMKQEDCLFDTWKDTPDIADVMCGSRFTVLGANEDLYGGQDFQELETFGTEVVNSIKIYYQQGTTVGMLEEKDSISTSPNLARQCMLSSIDWKPIFYYDQANTVYVMSDLDNFAVVSAYNLSRIHDVAAYSGFKLPHLMNNSDVK